MRKKRKTNIIYLMVVIILVGQMSGCKAEQKSTQTTYTQPSAEPQQAPNMRYQNPNAQPQQPANPQPTYQAPVQETAPQQPQQPQQPSDTQAQ